jgi:hypothetical protein
MRGEAHHKSDGSGHRDPVMSDLGNGFIPEMLRQQLDSNNSAFRPAAHVAEYHQRP